MRSLWQVDLTDTQWRDFRSNLPILVVLLAFYVALGRAASRVGMRLGYYVLSSTAFLFYAYGANALFVLALAVANFAVSCVSFLLCQRSFCAAHPRMRAQASGRWPSGRAGGHLDLQPRHAFIDRVDTRKVPL